MLCAALSACGTTNGTHSRDTAGQSTPEHRTTQGETRTSTSEASHTGSITPKTTTPVRRPASSTRSSGSTDDFCSAVAAINEIPDSDTLSLAEREHALRVIDNLLRLWPAETTAAAQTYFGEIRKAVEAGTAVDLDTTSTEFQAAFAAVFGYAADTCPGGFG